MTWHDFTASPISVSTSTEPQTWGKKHHFLCIHSRLFPCFCQINRLKWARKVIQKEKATKLTLYG